MADMDDEYERERQENIRKNQELLLSLGLNSNSGRKNVVREKKRRDVESPEVGVSNGTTSRSSTRLSSQPRRSYAPLPKQKAVVAKPVMRAGTRKSARILNGGLRSSLKEEDDDDDDRSMQMENTLNSRNMSTLRRIKNPVPMISVDYEEAEEEEYDRAPLPNRDVHGNILFENKNRHFMPNLTPEEMLRGGIFGGTAFRPYISSVTGQQLSPHQDLHEFPSNWYSGLDEDEQLTSSTYDPQMNRFGVKAGQSLEEWEKAGWVRRQDPRGWWQWYFRFYLGRRTSDDARQIGRFLKACGPSGRFKRSLVTKIHNAGATFDDERISPVVRQTLFHWAYQLNQVDYEAYLP